MFISKIRNIDFGILFLALVPLGYIIGGATPGISATAIIYAVLYLIALYRMIIKKESFKVTLIDILFYAWLLLIVISLFYTSSLDSGVDKAFNFIFLGLGLIFFSRLFLKTKNDVEKFFKYLLISSVVLELVVLIDFFTSGVPAERYIAFGTIVPIPLSMLGATTALIAFLLLIYNKISLFKLLLILIPSVGMMTLAASKGPVTALIITLVFMLPVIVRKVKIRYFFLLPFIGWVLLQIPFINQSYMVLRHRFENFEGDQSTTIRLNLYENASDIISQNFFTGVGIGGLGDSPHNFFIEILAENGILLFIIVSILLVIFAIKYVNFILNGHKNYLEALIFALVIISLSSLMFSFTYTDHKYFFVGIGVIIAYFSLSKKEKSAEDIRPEISKKRRFKRYKIVWR